MSNFANLGAAPSTFEWVDIQFGDWLPDLMALNNPGACEALNVIPKDQGYTPFNTLLPQEGLILNAPCKGALSVNDRFGSNHLYAATTNEVFISIPGPTFSNILSLAGLQAYSLWQLVPFGDAIVAIQPEIVPGAGQLGSATPLTSLGGTPPKASCGAQVGDFLVLGNLIESQAPYAGMEFRGRIRWNGFNNITASWTTDPATQADFNDMPSNGGIVIAITGREFGTVFQERSISRMTYVGLPAVFDIETIEFKRGALSVGSVVDAGSLVFFIAEDGFFTWSGAGTTPIGDEKVNEYFFARLSYSERRRVVGSIDYINQCVRWAFPVGTGADLTEQIIVNYRTGRWSHALYTVEYMIPAIADTRVGGLDRQPMAGFDTNHQYGFFNNSLLAATLETGDYTAPAGARVFISNSRPVVDGLGPDLTVQVGARDQLIGGDITYSAAAAQEITGECPVIADGRYVRFRVNTPAAGSWAHAKGVQAYRKAGGQA